MAKKLSFFYIFFTKLIFLILSLNIKAQSTQADQNKAAKTIQKAWLEYKNYLDFFFFKDNSSPYSIIKALPIYKAIRISKKLKDQINFGAKDKYSFNLSLNSNNINRVLTSYLKNLNFKKDIKNLNELDDYLEILSFAQAWKFKDLRNYLLKSIIKVAKKYSLSSMEIFYILETLNIDIDKTKKLLKQNSKYRLLFYKKLYKEIYSNIIDRVNTNRDSWFDENFIEYDYPRDFILNNNYLIFSVSNKVMIYNILKNNYKELFSLDGSNIIEVIICPNNKYLAFSNYNKKVYLYKLNSNSEKATEIFKHNSIINNMKFSFNKTNNFLVSCDYKGQRNIYFLDQEAYSTSLGKQNNGIYKICISYDDQTIGIANSNTIDIFKCKKFLVKKINQINFSKEDTIVKSKFNNNYLILISKNQIAKIYDINQNKIIKTFNNVSNLKIRTYNLINYLIIGFNNKKYKIFKFEDNLNDLNKIYKGKCSNVVTQIKFSSCNRYINLIDLKNNIKIFDLENKKVILLTKGKFSKIIDNYLYYLNLNKIYKINLNTKKMRSIDIIDTTLKDKYIITKAKFSQDSKYLVLNLQSSYQLNSEKKLCLLGNFNCLNNTKFFNLALGFE